MRRDPRRHQSVRGHLGDAGIPRSDRPRVHATLWAGDRRRPAGDSVLRRHRGDDGDDDWRSSIPATKWSIFEPFYENYGPDAILSGATPRYVTLREPDWSLRSGRARRAPSTIARRPSSSTRRTIPPARSSRARSSRRSPRCAASGMRSRSRTRSTSTSSTTAARTCRSRPSTAWPIGPSRSTASRRPTASPAGGSDGPSRRRR